MISANHHPHSGITKFIIPFLVLLFFAACNPNNDNTGGSATTNSAAIPSTEPATTTTTPVPVASALTGYLYDLTLTKAQYLTLRKSKPGGGSSTAKKMVFQFYFNNSVPNGPTLIAYAAKKQNKGNKFGPEPDPDPLSGRFSEVLAISNTPRLNLSAAPVNGKFTLGDQEITFKEIEDNYTLDLNPTGANFVLVFKPEQYGRNIRYRICLEGAACPNPAPPTQPSPPANTQ